MSIYKSLHWFCPECEPVVVTKLSSKNSGETSISGESVNHSVHSCEIASTILNGITEPLKNMKTWLSQLLKALKF